MGRPNNMILVTILLVVVIMFIFQQTSKNPKCKDTLECLRFEASAPIKIGVIHHPSGDKHSVEHEQTQIVRLALSDRGNEIYKHPIVANFKEIDCSESAGEEAVKVLIEEKAMLGIISIVCPVANISAAKFASQAGLVLMSGTDNSPRSIKGGDQLLLPQLPGYFRTIYNKAESAKAAASFALRKLGLTNAAVVKVGDKSGQIYNQAFIDFFKQLGGKVSTITSLSELSAVHPDFLFLAASTSDSHQLIKGVQSNPELNDLKIFCSLDLLELGFLRLLGADSRDVYFIESDRYDFSLESQKVNADYKAKFGNPPQYQHYGQIYDAATLFLLTIKASSLPRSKGILTFGRQRFRDILKQVVNFKGITGSLNCTADGECGASRFKIMRMNDPQKGLDGLRKNVVFVHSSN